MTLVLDQNGTVHNNSITLADAPAVQITGSDVHFVNQAGGRVESTAAGVAAISIEAAGAIIVNDLNGVIAAFAAGDLAIAGSGSADTVDSAGTITGRVELGGGADLFVRRNDVDGTVDLGADSDIYRIVDGTNVAETVIGGTGADTVELTGNIGTADGAGISGFETLSVGNQVLNVANFSGYQTVTLAPAGFANFVDSNNPLADLALTGGVQIIGRGSVFRNVAGSAGTDDFEVNSGTILGPIDLAGGDDIFTYRSPSAVGIEPTLGGTVTGGAGSDRLHIAVDGGQTVDLAAMTGFEQLNSGTFTGLVGNVRLLNADGYLQIAADGNGGILTLADSNSPDADVRVAGQGKLVLEATATIGLVGSALGSGDRSFNVTNNGNILGNVVFSTGNDVYDGRLGTEGGTIFGDAGNDTLLAGAGNDRIEAGSGSDSVSGADGIDVLLGGDGNDRLDGGFGADTIDGGAGVDTAVYAGIYPVWVDLLAGAGYWNAAFQDSLVGIENISGSHHNDWLYGDNGSNRLEGGLGNDLLVGRAGVDALLGGDGNDRLDGGLGADTINGGAGIDTAEYAGSYAVWVDLATGTGYWNGAFNDVLTGIENLGGSDNNDWLFGDGGNNRLDGGLGNDLLVARNGVDVLIGGAGNDRLDGGLGADTIDGGAGVDTVEYAGSYAVWVDLLAATGYWNAAFDDTLIGVENISGSSNNDWLFGDNGNNRLDGGLGNDLLVSRNGADVLIGGAGNDRLDGGLGADTIDGGAGVDTAEYAGSYAVWVDLADGTGYWNAAFDDTLTGIENLLGSSAGDWLFGDAGNNRLEGGLGDDHLVGRGGNDTLVGGVGNDRLGGGLGTDVLTGGAGSDMFEFDTLTGTTTVTDFESADKIRFATSVFADYQDVSDDMSQAGSAVHIAASAGTIVLADTQLADLSEASFVFG